VIGIAHTLVRNQRKELEKNPEKKAQQRSRLSRQSKISSRKAGQTELGLMAISGEVVRAFVLDNLKFVRLQRNEHLSL
jgi:hypothetical protein